MSGWDARPTAPLSTATPALPFFAPAPPHYGCILRFSILSPDPMDVIITAAEALTCLGPTIVPRF
jgi:hypothetical protein